MIVAIIIGKGTDYVQTYSPYILLLSALVCLITARLTTHTPSRLIRVGLRKSASQIIPAIPTLALIGTLSATWMFNGVVPTLIDYGLLILNPQLFLFITCIVCSLVSVMSGSSWTTIATIGVAFLGIGTVMGYSTPWIAGAIISGAYFGDKVSPLSDTTVLASSSCGVDLFSHIRYLMFTTVPAMVISLIAFAAIGFFTPLSAASGAEEIIGRLSTVFHITPWVLVIPALTFVFLALKIGTNLTLALSSVVGLVGVFVFQPQIVEHLTDGTDGGFLAQAWMAVKLLCTDTSIDTGNELLDSLVSTGGIAGMMPTIFLVLCAMIFGGAMMGTGMLASITRSVTDSLSSPRNLVGATVGTGLFLNCTTGDQYLSIIIGSNLYKKIYSRNGLQPRLLSRSIEDSVSVTSVLIPWNSCGVTQSTVLGVATLAYLPCCLFNLLSPLMTLIMASIGYRIHHQKLAVSEA